MSVVFFGDVYLDKKYNLDFDYQKCIFNLEFAITNSNNPAKDKINLKAGKSHILDTFDNKVEAVSLANNHSFDFNQEGFTDTIKNLEEQKVNYFGAGDTSDNFNNPHLFTMGSKKIAVLGYNCCTTHPAPQTKKTVANIDKENILKDIDSIKNDVDFTILYLHWGIEEIPFPKYSDRVLAHFFIDNGVDLIVGQHSHVIQSYEIYKNKHIFYSLGNFIFPDLNHESCFDGKRYTRKFTKTQQKRHLQSIVVKLNDDLKVEYFTVKLEGNTISKSSFRIPKWLPKSEINFNKRMKFQRKVNMFTKFISNPKFPNIEQLTRFIGIKN